MFNQIWKRSFANPESSSTPSSDNGSNSGSNLTNVKWRVEILKAVDDINHAAFNTEYASWGTESFLFLSKLHDPKRRYLVDDACLVEAFVYTVSTEVSNRQPDKVKTESVGIPTQPSCQIEAVEPGEPTEEDIKTFFTSLESELSSSHTDPSPLTVEQKNELLAMGECLKELADRAAKAVQDKARLTEMESIKLKIAQQKHAALLAEQKEIFRSSKKMKMELEAVGKEWTGYEANAKAAEAEWGRLKDFISSIKGKI
ncbi:hypothetical protein V6N13_091714 [Hibiscus sabdariffa]